MSTDTTVVEAPAEADLETQLEQDTNVVEDVVLDEGAEEKKDADLVDQVEKYLQQDEAAAEKSKKPEEPKQQAGGDDEKAPAEGADDGKKPDDLSQALKIRAQEAGIHETLAERLHQNGLLEESLAAMDRQLIDAVAQNEAMQQQYQQSAQTQPPPQRQAPLQEADRNRSGGDDAPPALDAEDYGEGLIARDTYHQKRIDQLEAHVAQLSQLAGGFVQQQSVQLDEWFDKTVEALDNEELFGKGDIHSLPQKSPQWENRIKLFRAYRAVCQVHGANHLDCNEEFAQRAYPAAFHDQVYKTAQQQTVERLRDAQGKFVSPSRPSGGGPPSKLKQLSDEERTAALVSDVDTYLKTGKRPDAAQKGQ